MDRWEEEEEQTGKKKKNAQTERKERRIKLSNEQFLPYIYRVVCNCIW